MNLTIQEPPIYVRYYHLDFLPWNVESDLMKMALTFLSLYKPITPYMSIGLNSVRGLPTLQETIVSIKKGEPIEFSQWVETAYRVSHIGVTLINPLCGMLMTHIEDCLTLLATSCDSYSAYRLDIETQANLVSWSLSSLVFCSHLLSFFKSDPRILAITVGAETVVRAISLFNKGVHDTPSRVNAVFQIMMVMIRGYQYQLAVNPPLEITVDQPEYFPIRNLMPIVPAAKQR